MDGQSLFQRIHDSKRVISGTKITVIALGIAYGMAHLHVENIIYRNLMSFNVILDEYDYPCINDLGICRNCLVDNEEITPRGGTAPWTVPEVLNGQADYSFSSDVYGYGVTLYELATNEIPWKNLTGAQKRILSARMRNFVFLRKYLLKTDL